MLIATTDDVIESESLGWPIFVEVIEHKYGRHLIEQLPIFYNFFFHFEWI